MSFTSTTNYALQKPGVGTELDAWGDDLNGNLDLIDTRMKINADAAAAATTLAGSKANSVHTHAASDITSGQFASAQIADAAITNAKLAAMAASTIKGSVSGGVPADLTGAQVAAIVGSSSAVVADDSITNAKLTNMAAATIKGSVAGGDPADLTATEATSLLNAFTTSLKGVVPASGGGTSNFMRADGTWAAPPAAGAVAWGTITGTLSSQTDLNTALTTETVNAQTGTSYTLVASDAGKMVTCNNGGATFTLTVNASVFPTNARVDILQLGAAQVTFAGTATRRANPSGANKLTGQYSGATLWFISASEYVLFGDITT